MDALLAILTRRSTRNFKPDAVEEDKLEKISSVCVRLF